MGTMVKCKEYMCITNTQVIITWFGVGMQRGAKERKHGKSTFTRKSTTKWQKKQIYQAKYKTVIKQSSGFGKREREMSTIFGAKSSETQYCCGDKHPTAESRTQQQRWRHNYKQHMKAVLMKEWANTQQINRLILSTIEYYAAVSSLDFRPTLVHKFHSFLRTHTFLKWISHAIEWH